ncbi:hypothetical protein FALB51S_01758 [Frigidibacter albus]|uniref:Uncharacterized protein n=1 Tax=Frigidibacter mobilis TaxID=1335048 RepID=A0A165SH86_9RHOB|nr:hypothetical protein AKL17_0800 [Frigidibacter mobilis]
MGWAVPDRRGAACCSAAAGDGLVEAQAATGAAAAQAPERSAADRSAITLWDVRASILGKSDRASDPGTRTERLTAGPGTVATLAGAARAAAGDDCGTGAGAAIGSRISSAVSGSGLSGAAGRILKRGEELTSKGASRPCHSVNAGSAASATGAGNRGESSAWVTEARGCEGSAARCGGEILMESVAGSGSAAGICLSEGSADTGMRKPVMSKATKPAAAGMAAPGMGGGGPIEAERLGSWSFTARSAPPSNAGKAPSAGGAFIEPPVAAARPCAPPGGAGRGAADASWCQTCASPSASEDTAGAVAALSWPGCTA